MSPLDKDRLCSWVLALTQAVSVLFFSIQSAVNTVRMREVKSGPLGLGVVVEVIKVTGVIVDSVLIAGVVDPMLIAGVVSNTGDTTLGQSGDSSSLAGGRLMRLKRVKGL